MRLFLIILLSLISLTAIVSGGFMILYPGGTALNLPLSILEPTPFQDFMLPGWLLLGVGLVHLYALLQWWQKSGARFNWSIIAGIVISGWIVVQMLLLAIVNWWQIGYLFAGILIILTAWQLKGKWLA
ncbi:MAG TPA: hypothetical protein VHM26_05550 [Chitinophagaceae bacterium]|nr:hypothetical protein [Chitinophagaceae bacterium]